MSQDDVMKNNVILSRDDSGFALEWSAMRLNQIRWKLERRETHVHRINFEIKMQGTSKEHCTEDRPKNSNDAWEINPNKPIYK